MLIKPTQGPTVPQTNRSILTWLMNKATAADDGTWRFSGRLPHQAVERLVHVAKTAYGMERAEQPFDGGTLYNYKFMIVHTIKGRFRVSVERVDGRPPGGKYQVKFSYQAISFEELLEMRGIV